MKAGYITDDVSVVLQDTTHDRWTEASLLKWLSEAQRAIARTPGAYCKTVTMTLSAGTRQTLPSDAWMLMSVTNNVDTDDTPLQAVRITTRSLLDAAVPFWHELSETTLVDNYVFDDRVPREFSVFPPNDGTGKVQVIYAAIPSEITSRDDDLSVEQVFEPALKAYVLSCAYAVDSDFSAGSQLSTGWFTAYSEELNKIVQAKGLLTPNAAFTRSPVKPNGGTE